MSNGCLTSCNAVIDLRTISYYGNRLLYYEGSYTTSFLSYANPSPFLISPGRRFRLLVVLYNLIVFLARPVVTFYAAV